jgi:thiosulfate/3-mercaptopyruvate sulfurtransferase
VGTDWLAAHLAEPSVRVLECTVFLHPGPAGGYRVESGRAAWADAHIPGSGFADLTGDLSDQATPLRFMMPSAAQFASAMSRLGVGDGVRVILYDRSANMWAARVWWMLRAMGFDDAAVLDGGWKKWTGEGRSVAADPGERPARRFFPRPRPELFVDRHRVLESLGDPTVCLLNALTEEQHRGTGGVYYGRPGRIPSSVNVAAQGLVDPTTHAYVSLEALRAKFARAGATEAGRVITYCGSGIAASSDAFVLTLLGHGRVAVYDGSLYEWANDPALPMESG